MLVAGNSGVGCGHTEGTVQIRAGPVIPEKYIDLDYGTSGYRGLADTPPNHLDHVVYRCGVLMAALPFLRNPSTLYAIEGPEDSVEGAAAVSQDQLVLSAGTVITASHNEAAENGIKLLEGDGCMLDAAWEFEFTALINFRGELSEAVAHLFNKYALGPIRRNATQYRILIGYDTRVSSPHLASLFRDGVEAMAEVLKLEGTRCVDLGVVTTPTVGFLLNNSMLDAVNDDPYVEELKDAFNAGLTSLVELGHMKKALKTGPRTSLFYDCSYGVGGCVIYKFFDCLRQLGVIPHLCHSPVWLDESSRHMLNNGCGADYVLSKKQPPVTVEQLITIYEGEWFCSFDGDADRLVYFMPHKGSIKIIDGVRLLAVKMKFLAFILSRLDRTAGDAIKVAVMVNHYANGGAIRYITRCMDEWNASGCDVKWALELCRVGVKNMLDKVPKYDISVFYEANGHGSLVFNKECAVFRSGKQCAYTRLLAHTARMFRSQVGDAVANSLFIQLAMRVLRLSYEDVLGFYEELPYVNATFPIPASKRGVLRARSDNDAVLEEPLELQRLVEKAAGKVLGARAFIRPSGTEPLCRIYAEAPSEEQANKLAADIADCIKQFV